jgi:hypothetical protein
MKRLFFAAVALVAMMPAGQAAPTADPWEEDFRRCRVLKNFSEGRIDISMGEKSTVEIYVLWNDGADFDSLGVTHISVRIDNAPCAVS